MTAIRVTGDTFAHRERLKYLGGRWDSAARNWLFESVRPKDLAELKNMAGCLVTDDVPPPQPEPKQRNDFDDLRGAIELIEREREKAVDGKFKTVVYGDDPTYFNHMKDKNPRAFFGFSSLGEMVKFVDAIPSHKRSGDRNQGWITHRGNWHGTPDMPAALRIAREGWQNGAAKAAQLTELLGLENAVSRSRAYSVAGGSVSVGKMLSGNPQHMIRRPKQPGRKLITLFVENVASAYIKPEMLLARASVIAAVVDLLEMRGYSCTIVATSNQAAASGPAAQTAVTVKHAGERLNLSDVVFALGHPSFLRRLCFACVSQADELRNIWESQGRPANAFDPDDMERGEYYIPKLSDNLDAKDFITLTKRLLPLVLPDGLPIKLELEK